MTKVQHLYGEDVDTQSWEKLGYKEVLELKAELAYQNIKKLNEVHYMERDTVHVNDCIKAISFNNDLLKELK